MKKALIIALAAAALVVSGIVTAQAASNPYQSTAVSSQTQDVKHKGKKCKKGKGSKSTKHRQKKQ